jgi:hypothetical protein
VYDYYQKGYEARERIEQRRRQADAERNIRQARARQQRRRRRAHLAAALDLLNVRRQARANA